MDKAAILAPIGALAFLTFAVLTLVPIARFGGLAKREVKPGDFKYGESASVPGPISLPNRNYMNLLELPVLFYVLCLMLYVTERTSPLMLQLAWAYVGARALHSVVHLVFNHLLLRPIVFGISNLILLGMWVLFYFPRLAP